MLCELNPLIGMGDTMKNGDKVLVRGSGLRVGVILDIGPESADIQVFDFGGRACEIGKQIVPHGDYSPFPDLSVVDQLSEHIKGGV